MAITVEYLQSIAVSITPGSRPTLLHPQNAEAQKTVENRVVSGQSRLVKVGLAWCRVFFLVPCGVVADGHHKQRAILRRKQIPG